jgi:hypothetical protein
MAGYASRLIRLDFPELSEDPENDPIFVTIRNPKLMPLQELQDNGGNELDADGNPVQEKATAGMLRIISRLIAVWRVYDATHLQINPTTGEVMDQPLLPLPATPELVGKLPSAIINRIGDELTGAVNPQ